MRKLFVLFTLIFLPTAAWSQSEVPDDTKFNHAWIQGVYWNPGELPGWGFFVDVQEETMFGAIYGYMGSDSTFITLQGTLTSADPLVFRGDAFFVSNGGAAVTDVGNFTWSVKDFEASPAAALTLSSNILDVTNLDLTRFKYAESDKLDMLTGGDWNMIRRIFSTFGDSYVFSDDRSVDDGITFAEVIDNSDNTLTGQVGYFPPGRGELYAMLLEFDEDTNVFYVFFASNTDMFGRYWLLDEGEIVDDNHHYFNGSVDTMQAVNAGLARSGVTESLAGDSILSDSKPNRTALTEMEEHQKAAYENPDEHLEPMFSDSLVQDVYQIMLRQYRSSRNHLK